LKNYIEAEKYILKGLGISDSISASTTIMEHHDYLFQVYNATGNYKKALDHYRQSVEIKDSLFNEQKDKEITSKAMTYEFEKKEAITKAEHEKKEALSKAEIKHQTLIRNSTFGGV